jgi:hypothetical protein
MSHSITLCMLCTRAVCKVRGLTLFLRVGTLCRCGDGLFFEVPPLASDELLTTLHPLLEIVLHTVCHKLQEDNGTGGFDLVIWLEKPRNRMVIWLEKPRNRMVRYLECITDVLMGMMAVPIRTSAPWYFWVFPTTSRGHYPPTACGKRSAARF